MKLAILGNLANVGVNLLQFINRKNVDCDLILSQAEFDELDERDRTSFSDKIRVWDKNIGNSLLKKAFFISTCLLRRNVFYHYDVIISMAGYNTFSRYVRVPFIAIATGSDIREESYKPKSSRAYKKGFRNAKVVLTWLFDDRAVSKARMFKLNQFRLFNYPVDTEVFKPREVNLPERKDYDFIIFNASRLDWAYKGKKRWLGALKGNDRLINAFARLLKNKDKFNIKNPLLILVKGDVDTDATINLIKGLGIENNVIFKEYMDFDERIDYINGADVLADHFNTGSFGGTFVEILSCGKPLIHYVDTKNWFLTRQKPPPILNAHTEDEIYEKLVEALDKEKREELGKKARQWVMEYHHWEKPVNELLFYCSLIVGEKDILDIEQ